MRPRRYNLLFCTILDESPYAATDLRDVSLPTSLTRLAVKNE